MSARSKQQRGAPGNGRPPSQQLHARGPWVLPHHLTPKRHRGRAPTRTVAQHVPAHLAFGSGRQCQQSQQPSPVIWRSTHRGFDRFRWQTDPPNSLGHPDLYVKLFTFAEKHTPARVSAIPPGAASRTHS